MRDVASSAEAPSVAAPHYRTGVRSLRGVRPSPAVVLGLNPNALGTIRALAREGIDVVVIGPSPGGATSLQEWMSARTRLARVLHIARDRWPGDLSEVLMACAATWTGRAVLIPSGDAEVAMLLQARHRLSEAFEIVLPDGALVERLVDKVTFCQFATERNVPAPVTLAGLNADAVDQRSHDLRFPCIIKPAVRDAAWDLRFGMQKVLECPDRAALRRLFRRAAESHPSLIIQEVVPGPDDQIVFSHTYVGRDGRERAMWTGRKVRQHPIHFGSATLAALEWIPDVAALTRKLLADSGFVGYASIEFKFDARDGEYRVLEATVGRTCYHHGLGLAAKVNIPLIWYRDALGLPVDPVAAQYDRSVWIDEYRDLAAAIEYAGAGELSFAQWLRSFRGARHYAHLSWNDPVPGLYLVARLLLAATRVPGKMMARVVRGRSPRDIPRNLV